MGIKGTVVRSQDTHFIHTNIDIDLIITEEHEYGVPDKPQEIFHIIERFCLGKRRLYLFGRDNTGETHPVSFIRRRIILKCFICLLIKKKQAAAATGQSMLMHAWESVFDPHDIIGAGNFFRTEEHAMEAISRILQDPLFDAIYFPHRTASPATART